MVAVIWHIDQRCHPLTLTHPQAPTLWSAARKLVEVLNFPSRMEEHSPTIVHANPEVVGCAHDRPADPEESDAATALRRDAVVAANPLHAHEGRIRRVRIPGIRPSGGSSHCPHPIMSGLAAYAQNQNFSSMRDAQQDQPPRKGPM